MQCNFYKRQLVSILLSFALLGGVAHAQMSAQQSSAKDSTVQTLQTNEANRKAQEWGLQPEEWERYKEVMDGPLGTYSPGLDPLTALGISARNDQERRQYAEKQVIAEMRRVERELLYQRAYDDAFKRLFPNMMPVDYSGSSQRTPVTVPSGDGRLAVFVKENCPSCEARVKQLQTAGTPFDIYMVDSKQDDTLIRRWATKAGIDAKKVLARTITLNHDAGRWQSIGLSGDFPAVVREVNGTWSRQ